MIKTDEILLNKNRYEFSSAFIDQRLPNLVQRLFADVIYDAIWLMNIAEQKYMISGYDFFIRILFQVYFDFAIIKELGIFH